MNDYIFLMHDDSRDVGEAGSDWDAYLARLRKSGRFFGGSVIGAGVCVSKPDNATGTTPLSRYIRVQASSLEEAKKLLEGNPVFEAGGTVEIRALIPNG